MLPDDPYKTKLERTIASVKAWTGFVADVARIEAAEVGDGWRLSLQPHSSRACPVEIVLRRDQTCDLAIGGETYRNWPLPSLDVVLPLMEAVSEGRVVTRHTVSATTGLLREVSTIVRLADGTVIEQRRDGAAGMPLGSVEGRDTHYLPYRRPNGAA